MVHIPEHMVFMEKVSSREHLLLEAAKPQRVLQDISLLIKKREIWGVLGPAQLEIKILLEIIANIRPYDSGRCVLIERGMPKHKRVILKHVFYIGSAEMIYNNMNVLEFLMFATAKSKMNKVLLQEQIFNFILKIGLGHLSLTPSRLLTQEEKAVFTLIAATYSDSLIIVFNLPDFNFDDTLTNAIAKIASYIKEKGKTLILGTQICELVEKACTHTVVLSKGQFIYTGLVEDFRYRFDQVEVIIKDQDLTALKEALSNLLPGYGLRIKNNSLLISSGSDNNQAAIIYKAILDADLVPQQLEINLKNVQNAYEELMLQHDLSK